MQPGEETLQDGDALDAERCHKSNTAATVILPSAHHTQPWQSICVNTCLNPDLPPAHTYELNKRVACRCLAYRQADRLDVAAAAAQPFLAMKRTGTRQSGAAAASPAPGQKS